MISYNGLSDKENNDWIPLPVRLSTGQGSSRLSLHLIANYYINSGLITPRILNFKIFLSCTITIDTSPSNNGTSQNPTGLYFNYFLILNPTLTTTWTDAPYDTTQNLIIVSHQISLIRTTHYNNLDNYNMNNCNVK